MRTRVSSEAACLGLLTVLLFRASLGFAEAKEQTRALWVTRWEYRTQEDIERIIANAAALHFNVILLQVRGNGTVAYPSRFEPWSEELDGEDPGWDPLQYAIEQAHAKNMELHAWINVYPGWRGEEPPDDPSQLYLAHPDWFMVDELGVPQRLTPHYVWLSPTHPQVDDYLLNICSEIYTNYDVDGLHLDYVRYPAASYSFDTQSLKVFKFKYGSSPTEKPSEWSQWRRDAISSFVAKLYQSLKLHNPKLVLSASVVADYWNGFNIFMQDSHGWLANGIIDVIYPMIYTDDDTLFANQLMQHVLNNHGRHVYPGIHTAVGEHLLSQIQLSEEIGCPGCAVFSYGLFFPDHQANLPLAENFATLWKENVPTAPLPWKYLVGDTRGPVVAEVKTIPIRLRAEKEFKIAARIVDDAGVYDEKAGSQGNGVYLVYNHLEDPQGGTEVQMSRVKGAADWFITDRPIPAQPAGLDFRCRIYAWDDYHESARHPKRNLGYSDIWSLSILAPNETYFSMGAFGPLLWHATAIQVDARGQIWIGSNQEAGVIVLKPDGTPAPFSPIKTGMTNERRLVPLNATSGMAFVQPDVMCISSPKSGDSSWVFPFKIETGERLPGFAQRYRASEMDCDAEGHLFVLDGTSTRWHVLTMRGVELVGSPFGIKHTGNDIAVLDNAGMVFISDRTANTVQCWHGAVEGMRARYWRADDLPAADIGIGKLATDSSSYIYVSHTQRGVITIFDRVGKIVEHLSGGKPPLNAPREVGLSVSSDSLYVLEAVGFGASKLSLWVKQKDILKTAEKRR